MMVDGIPASDAFDWSDARYWTLTTFLDALDSGAVSVVDDAIAIEPLPVAQGIPVPGHVRAVLDCLLDGDITIGEPAEDGEPVVVEIATSHRTYRGTGPTLEVALGATVQAAIRESRPPEATPRHGRSPEASCGDGAHLWIGPVAYFDGPRLMCLHCLTTYRAPSRVPDAT